jgi:hypothetical protein
MDEAIFVRRRERVRDVAQPAQLLRERRRVAPDVRAERAAVE